MIDSKYNISQSLYFIILQTANGSSMLKQYHFWSFHCKVVSFWHPGCYKYSELRYLDYKDEIVDNFQLKNMSLLCGFDLIHRLLFDL